MVLLFNALFNDLLGPVWYSSLLPFRRQGGDACRLCMFAKLRKTAKVIDLRGEDTYTRALAASPKKVPDILRSSEAGIRPQNIALRLR